MKTWKQLAAWGQAKGKKLTVWGEWAARIWATYWLLIIGSLLVLGSIPLKWVEFPLSRNLSGLKLPVLRNVGLMPHLDLLSFGVLGIVVLFITLTLTWLGSRRALAIGAAALITLCLIVPYQIAFQQPAFLRRLSNEDQQVPLIRVFSSNYLPQNLGSAEDIPKRLILYNAWGRFLAACSFLELGWHTFAVGSLLIAIYSFGYAPGEKSRTALIVIGVPTAVLFVLLTPPLIGQHYFTVASVAKARGDNERAIANYRKAMRWDRWHAQNIGTYGTIGQLQKQAGIADGSPERHISRALELRSAKAYEPAIFEFNQAAAMESGPLAATARREAVRTRADFGLALYRAGSIGGAVTNWQQALADDPSQVQILPYLARGNFDIGRYQDAIDALNRWTKIATNHTSMLADAYSLAGDSYAKLGQDADARRYYNLSLTTDTILNHWALTGLIGN